MIYYVVRCYYLGTTDMPPAKPVASPRIARRLSIKRMMFLLHIEER